MKFKIFSKDSNGNNFVHYYDNISQDIENEQGIPIVLREDPRCANLVLEKKFCDAELKNKSDITTLRITLGFNCNFHCKYCLEHIVEDKKRKVIAVHEDLDAKAEKLVDRVVKNFPNVKTIAFWGGEPLVYIKLMRKIVECLKKRFDKLPRLSVITNGSLLNLNTAKWLYENKISVTVSHDGPSFNAYRDDTDPLDDPKSLEGIKFIFQKGRDDPEYSRPSFNIVVTPENCNLQEIIPFFERKLGFVPYINFESIARLDKETTSFITPFNADSTKLLLNNIVAFASTPSNEHDYGCLRDDVTFILKRLLSGVELPNTFCMIKHYNFAAIDTDGKVLVCHGNSNSYTELENIDKVKFPQTYSWHSRPSCIQCPFLVGCLGGCPLVDEDGHEYQCKNLKIWFGGLFIAAWKVLFDTTIYKIEPLQE